MRIKINISGILLVLLAATASGTIIPVFAAQDDFILANSKLSVKFEGNNPHIKFFLNKNENSSKSHYKLIFSSLIEYSDSDQDDIFTNGKDDQVESVSLESVNFEHVILDNTADGGVAVNFTSTSFCQCMPELTVIIRIYLYKQDKELYITGTDSSGVTTIETVTVEGNVELKFDVEIRNWPFSSENNRLALNIKILANTIFSRHGNDNITGGTIESQNSGERPYINYPDKAIADGEVVDVKADFTEKGVSNQDLQFNFPSFTNELIYDPVIGIDESSTVNAEGLLFLTVIFPIVYVYRRRKR
ncbi:MAG: hypothetical protein ACTSRU_07535 [Candidatus Hodarchaeales archaeon]